MRLFGVSPLEGEIEKATNEKNTTDQWSVIMDICDKISFASSASVKESLRIIIRRLNHQDPHVVMQAITLLDACVSNCGKNFHLEIASREFEQEFKKLVSKSQPQIATKLKLCLKKWAEGDFKSDPQLNLIPALYNKMKQEGIDFSEPQAPVKREVQLSKDPNVVSSQQEAEDIAKAIELSLKEKTASPKAQSYSATTKSSQNSSLYPSVNSFTSSQGSTGASASASASAVPSSKELRKVRALYDFEAAEDNELTFKAGEIIMVTEESDPNWWKGTNQRGEGYFPANFVTADLSMEPEDLTPKESKSNKKNVQFESLQEIKQEQAAEINEEAIDRLLFLLHEADPTEPSQDSDEMLRLENAVNQMGPLIDSELERVDRKHAQLTQLSSDLIDTINLYHSLMQTDNMVANTYGSGGFQQPQQMFRPPGAIFSPNHNNYGMNSMPPMNSMGGMMQYPMTNFSPAGSFQPPPPNGNFPTANNFPMYQTMPQNSQQPSQNNLPPMGNPQHNMMPQQSLNGPLQATHQMPHDQQQQQQQQHQQPPQQQQMFHGMFPQSNNNPQMAPPPPTQSIQSPNSISNTIGQNPQMMPPPSHLQHQMQQQQMQGGI